MPLNIEQQHAVESTSHSILCLAAAGSGKTFTLIERVCRLIDIGVKPSSILVLTFTNAAAFEMRQRFEKRCPGSYVEFRTFHAFCYSLLCSNSAVRKRLGYTVCPTIASESTQTLIDRTVCKTFGIKLSAAKRQGKETLSLREQQEYLTYMRAVEVEYKRRNLITFDQLCYQVCELFTSADPSVASYLSQYEHIMCDEFQDTDPKQFQFLLAFSHADVFLVGDVLQAIYEFRGADSTICKTIASKPAEAYHRCWEVITLPVNYRSDKAICEFANNHSVYAKSAYRLKMVPNSVDSGKVTEEYCSTYYSATNPVAPQVLKALKATAHTHAGSMAILARTNAEVSSIQDYLTSQGLLSSKVAWICDSLNIFRSGQDLSYAEDWCASLLHAEHYSDYIVWNATYSASEVGSEVRWKEFITKFGKLLPNTDIPLCIQAIRNVLISVQAPYSKCVSILKILAPTGTFADMLLKDDASVVRYIEDLIVAAPAEDIYVGTIHSAKGLEFDHVAIVNVDGRSFRLTSEANNNLYYVGITRAKHRLDVYRCVN